MVRGTGTLSIWRSAININPAQKPWLKLPSTPKQITAKMFGIEPKLR